MQKCDISQQRITKNAHTHTHTKCNTFDTNRNKMRNYHKKRLNFTQSGTTKTQNIQFS